MVCFGAAKDVYIPQRNAANTATPTVAVSPAVDSLLGFGADKTVGNVTLAGSLTLAGGVLTGTGGAGSVTSVSVTTANGVSGSVATATTTPAITLTLGAITPSSVNGNTITTGTGTLTIAAAKVFTVSNTLTLSGTDGSTLNMGTGGTLGTNAFNSTSYQPLDAALTALAGGSDFVTFSGPATTTKTFTLPDATATILTSNAAVTVAQGGTGQTTYTNGQLLIGNTTGNTLAKATLTGTSNQIVITNGTGSITLSTPQSIATSSTPQFERLGIGQASSTNRAIRLNGTITASVGTAIGVSAVPSLAAAANSDSLQIVRAEADFGKSSFTSLTAFGVYSTLAVSSGAGTISNAYGFYAGPVTVGTANWSVFTESTSGIASFGDATEATTSTDGSFRVAGGLSVVKRIVTASTITTAAPSGGTAAPFKIGTVSVTSPTSPNRTIEIEVNGTTYYLSAKTTNN